MTLQYEGHDDRDVQRTGLVIGDDPRPILRNCWSANWRWLVVRDEQQKVVGVIGKRRGHRQWMAWSGEQP